MLLSWKRTHKQRPGAVIATSYQRPLQPLRNCWGRPAQNNNWTGDLDTKHHHEPTTPLEPSVFYIPHNASPLLSPPQLCHLVLLLLTWSFLQSLSTTKQSIVCFRAIHGSDFTTPPSPLPPLDCHTSCDSLSLTQQNHHLTSVPEWHLSRDVAACPSQHQQRRRERERSAMAPSSRHSQNLGQIIEYIPGMLVALHFRPLYHPANWLHSHSSPCHVLALLLCLARCRGPFPGAR